MSNTRPNALDAFALFYEELTEVKPVKQRLRRPRVSKGTELTTWDVKVLR